MPQEAKKPEKSTDQNYNLSEIIKRLNILSPDQSVAPDFTIIVDEPTRDLREVLPKLKQQIPSKYWWLNDEFKNREKPSQYELLEGNSLYDFTGEISPERLAIINQINSYFGKNLQKYNLTLPKYLIFDSKHKENFNSGFPMNGQILRGWNAIQFYPEAFTSGKYRARENSKFPNSLEHFLGVLVHEYSHFLDPQFIQIWKNNFGWVDLENVQKLYGNVFKMEECLKPEKCMGDYALFSSHEDFCESMVAYLLTPETIKLVSEEKFKFLKSILVDDNLILEVKNPPDIEKKSAFPSLPEKITVKTKKSSFKWSD